MSILDIEAAPAATPTAAHRVGAAVAVRNRYLGTWSSGFEVAGLRRGGCLIRRCSDGWVFPEVIPYADVREPLAPVPD